MAGFVFFLPQKGISLLKKNIKENLKYAVLLDENKKEIKRYEFFSIYYDENGVLTALFEVPVEDNLTIPMKYLRVVNSDEVVISEGETPEITFVTGIGGVQTLKFAVSGEAGEIVFKANDYITKVEFDELYLPIVTALTNRVTQLENILIEKGVIDG